MVFTVLLFDANVPNGNLIASVAVVGVTLSVIAHGFTAPPLVAAYARWWSSAQAGNKSHMEANAVAEHPARHASVRATKEA